MFLTIYNRNRQQNLQYISVDGNQTVEKVFAEIKAIL